MIQTELLQDGKLIRHYSDSNFMIRQIETGTEYSDAIDVVPCAYTYEETDTQIPSEEAEIGDYQSALKRLGVDIND